jgi:hypothetical protein
MEEYTMNERILMKLAEAEKKQSIKQTLKDNAWTIGLSTIAPSVGFAIDQHRANIKKEKATGEKPKSLIERHPGVVGGVVAGGLINPLTRMAKGSLSGVRTSPAQLASEMVGGAVRGAVGGALIVDPLTRWGTRKYYQHRDKEIERAIRNRIQEGSLQKEAAYAEAEKKRSFKQKLKDNAWTIGLSAMNAPNVGFAIDQQRRNIKKEKATGEKPKSLIEQHPGTVSGAVAGGLIYPLARMAVRSIAGAQTSPAQLKSEMVRGATSGALGGLLFVDPLTRWGTRKYYQRRDEEIERAIRNKIQEGSLQKEAAYGDTIKNLASRVGSGARNTFQKLRNTPYGNTIKNLASRVESGARNTFQKLRNTPRIIKPLQQFAQRNAKALTAGGIGLGAAGAIAGGIAAARAIKNKRQGQEKTASYYAARELLGLQKRS